MAAMMVLMFVMMMMMTGPHHGFARPDVGHPAQTEAPDEDTSAARARDMAGENPDSDTRGRASRT